MTSRATDEPFERLHVHLYASDVAYIRATFGGHGNIGQNAAIRAMVRSHVRALRARTAATASAVAITDADLERARASDTPQNREIT